MTDEKLTRIKELLVEWARCYHDEQGGFPSQSAFVALRVDGGNRNTDSYHDGIPAVIVTLNSEIGRFAPGFRAIVTLEYTTRQPQKTKAARLGIPRQVYNQRLMWIYEQLYFAMFGE